MEYTSPKLFRGVSAYFCHNSYVAQVLDLTIENGKPVIKRVCCAVDCGIVVNPDAATNLAEGAIVDAVEMLCMEDYRSKTGSRIRTISTNTE